MVVSMYGKGSGRSQAGTRKMSESKPRLTHRNLIDDIKTRVAYGSWDKFGRNLLTARVMSGVDVA
jgi:hypothetical protein